MKNFWQTLPSPFTALAPLDGVTDVVFRQIVTEIGKPDVLFTEFTMTDGLVSKAKEKVAERLLLTNEQKPVIAQIWGTNPEHFYQSAKEMKERGFAGIDINMGCPVRDVTNRGACSALIKNPNLALEIINATREGSGELPVSVKTRLGFEKIATDTWIKFLLEQQLPALTVHLRTVRELSKVPAHWDEMKKIIKLRNEIAPETLIVGNGDLVSLAEIKTKYKEYGCDGFMVGRGIFANPWFFNISIDVQTVNIRERINLYLHHIALFEKQWKSAKHFALLKKFAKTYINNFPDASSFREQLMESKSIEELKETLNKYLQNNTENTISSLRL
jgi:tRNA-dihydrouridine synthase